MKVLVFSMACHGFQEACQYEAALEQNAKGNEVLFLYCDGTLGICGENLRCNSLKCKICKFRFEKRIKKYLTPNIHHVPLSTFLTKNIIDETKKIHFDYKNADELKEVYYHGIDIGFGAISSYISWTRNLNPILSNEVRTYFDLLLKLEVKLTLILENLLSEFKADMIVFHNGRFAFFKPVYRIAQLKNIPFICTETAFDINRHVYREFIFDDIPHSIDFWTKKMNMYWEKEPNIEIRKEIGKTFFENRRNDKYSGDKIYTKNQSAGKLPEGFDKSIENIAIFNSSEDEFGAIGQEVSKYALFKSQYDGIVAIAERYKEDTSKHFYLRVHPNLNDVPFDYHLNLYKLKYPNLTVIPGTSDISSYALMDAADKIIVFGSTMGAESAYWGKPVICLSFALYYKLGCAYLPKNKEEVWKLIETKELPPLDSESPLKFGYCILTPNKERFHYINLDDSTFMFRGRQRLFPSIYKFLGSTKLCYILSLVLSFVYDKMTFLGRFSRVPV